MVTSSPLRPCPSVPDSRSRQNVEVDVDASRKLRDPSYSIADGGAFGAREAIDSKHRRSATALDPHRRNVVVLHERIGETTHVLVSGDSVSERRHRHQKPLRSSRAPLLPLQACLPHCVATESLGAVAPFTVLPAKRRR